MATNYTTESDFYSESDNYGKIQDETTSFVKNYRGQLQLNIQVQHGRLTIHIISALDLHSRNDTRTRCSSYVKLCLAPDQDKQTRCRTEVIYNSNNPTWDEKFSFDLYEEDVRKRLFIAVWNKDEMGCIPELLGCMSFGMERLTSTKAATSGWYHLLSEQVGKRKHLQAKMNKRPPPVLPKINQGLQFAETHTFTIKHGGKGYGFSVAGYCPVYISKIEKGSPAHLAGLQDEDLIVRVNSVNVSRSSAQSIAKIIRANKGYIHLEVQRPPPQDNNAHGLSSTVLEAKDDFYIDHPPPYTEAKENYHHYATWNRRTNAAYHRPSSFECLDEFPEDNLYDIPYWKGAKDDSFLDVQRKRDARIQAMRNFRDDASAVKTPKKPTCGFSSLARKKKSHR
ncbi:DgyrCDS4466 [Dimorphilus gyrociliatus]|uniref:DgyrCDS4466 n=1 Tax=Dimorphilus gyrociliatus TaxID=2664684 RepID=A0A7I8VH52_9ANNE|nr:DgyrCDS4466 [Dimorphilus gyrociliatus]